MSVINNRAEQPGEGMGIGGETTSPLTPRHTTMARFGFSGDLGNADSITGLGWSFEGFSKGKGAKKTISLSGGIDADGTFSSDFRARGKTVKGWLNVEDVQGDGVDASFSYQGKEYDFNPGDAVKIKLTKKGRFQVVDHDLSLERERQTPAGGGNDPATGDDPGTDNDPVTGTGSGTDNQQFRDWVTLLDANGDGVFNSRDLILNPGRVSLLQQAEVNPGVLEELAVQQTPIADLVGRLSNPGSGFDTREVVNIFNQDVINPPNLLGEAGLGGF